MSTRGKRVVYHLLLTLSESPHLLQTVENRRSRPRLGAATVVAVRAVGVSELGETRPGVGGDVSAVPGEDRVDVVEGRRGVLRDGVRQVSTQDVKIRERGEGGGKRGGRDSREGGGGKKKKSEDWTNLDASASLSVEDEVSTEEVT